jgi:hypothetical protein
MQDVIMQPEILSEQALYCTGPFISNEMISPVFGKSMPFYVANLEISGEEPEAVHA